MKQKNSTAASRSYKEVQESAIVRQDLVRMFRPDAQAMEHVDVFWPEWMDTKIYPKVVDAMRGLNPVMAQVVANNLGDCFSSGTITLTGIGHIDTVMCGLYHDIFECANTKP